MIAGKELKKELDNMLLQVYESTSLRLYNGENLIVLSHYYDRAKSVTVLDSHNTAAQLLLVLNDPKSYSKLVDNIIQEKDAPDTTVPYLRMHKLWDLYMSFYNKEKRGNVSKRWDRDEAIQYAHDTIAPDWNPSHGEKSAEKLMQTMLHYSTQNLTHLLVHNWDIMPTEFPEEHLHLSGSKYKDPVKNEVHEKIMCWQSRLRCMYVDSCDDVMEYTKRWDKDNASSAAVLHSQNITHGDWEPWKTYVQKEPLGSFYVAIHEEVAPWWGRTYNSNSKGDFHQLQFNVEPEEQTSLFIGY